MRVKFHWPLSFCFLFFISGQSSFAQNVAGFVHAKVQNFQQTSATPPVMNAAAPFQFGSLITMGTANIASGMITFSGSSSPRSYDPVGNGDFSILDTFATQAQLDAAYGSGNYNLTVVSDAGTFMRSVFLFPFSYPTTPMITAPAPSWQNGALVIEAATDYNFTWNSFANAQPADGIELIIREAGLTIGPLPATQTSYLLPAGTLQPGMTYTCDLGFLRVAGASSGDNNIGPGYALLVKDTGFLLRTQAPALVVSSAVSRKIHGAAGTFDVDLPLSGMPGIESRTGGASGDDTVVVTFTNNVVSGNATVASGIGNVAGPPVLSGNTMTINLTGIANAQTIIINLSNVTDEFSQVLPDTTISASFLRGDTNANGSVNATDVSQSKTRLGQTLDATNFRSDVNVSGGINATDIGLIKSSIGTGLP